MYCFHKGALGAVLSVVFASTLLQCAALGQVSADSHSPLGVTTASPDALKSPSGSHLLVTVTSPWTNESVAGKVTIKATAQNTPLTNGGVAFWAIYESGTLVWIDLNPSSSISIPIAVTPGWHTFKIQAFDDSSTPSTVKVPIDSTSSGVHVGWHACMYTHNGMRYQAMKFYPHVTITGVLQSQMFYNSGCNPTQWTDQLNDYGTSMTFSAGSGWLFYFTHRANQPGVSAVWTLGNQTSGCVNYSTAPDC